MLLGLEHSLFFLLGMHVVCEMKVRRKVLVQNLQHLNDCLYKGRAVLRASVDQNCVRVEEGWVLKWKH